MTEEQGWVGRLRSFFVKQDLVIEDPGNMLLKEFWSAFCEHVREQREDAAAEALGHAIPVIEEGTATIEHADRTVRALLRDRDGYRDRLLAATDLLERVRPHVGILMKNGAKRRETCAAIDDFLAREPDSGRGPPLEQCADYPGVCEHCDRPLDESSELCMSPHRPKPPSLVEQVALDIDAEVVKDIGAEPEPASDVCEHCGCYLSMPASGPECSQLHAERLPG